MGLGGIGLYLSSEFIQSGYQVHGLDRRNNTKQIKKRFNLTLNGKTNLYLMLVDNSIRDETEVIVVTTKSYNLSGSEIKWLIDCKKEILFLQNGLQLKQKFQTSSDFFSFGTISGIQSVVNKNRVFVESKNLTLSAELNNKCSSLLKIKTRDNFFNYSIDFKQGTNLALYEKYVRWIVITSLNILYNDDIGNALKKADFLEIILAVNELIHFVQYEFKVSLNSERVIESIRNLPNNLVTSAFLDVKKGSLSEIYFELDYVNSVLASQQKRSSIIQKWTEKILYE